MILPIVAYGHPTLRKKAERVHSDHPGLVNLIADMWDTMYGSHGVGLAAPQVNRPIRLFVVDSLQITEAYTEQDKEEFGTEPGIRQVFLNARLIESGGTEWVYNEGCLSIPKIREDIPRLESLVLEYQDEEFREHRRHFSGVSARIIFHEYDHIEGRLFIDYLKPLKKRLIRNKLEDISRGRVKVDYQMLFPK